MVFETKLLKEKVDAAQSAGNGKNSKKAMNRCPVHAVSNGGNGGGGSPLACLPGPWMCNPTRCNQGLASSTAYCWRDAWSQLARPCQNAVLKIPEWRLKQTKDSYLERHSFCVDCSAMVNQAFQLLLDPVGMTNTISVSACPKAKREREKQAQPPAPPPTTKFVYSSDKVWVACEAPTYKRYNMWTSTDGKYIFVGNDEVALDALLAMAEPELRQSKQERHAKTPEIAQKEILTCVGVILHQRLAAAALGMREGMQVCQQVMLASLTCLRNSLEIAVEKNTGVSKADLLCKELEEDEMQKQVRGIMPQFGMH